VDGSAIGLAAVRHLVELSKSLAETPAVTLLYVDPPLLRSVALELGSDGVEGLRAIKEHGGYTIAEDKSTCIVYGMPKAAVDARVVDKVVPLGEMAGEIVKAVRPATAGAPNQ